MKENTKLLIGDGGMGSELRFRGVEVPSHIESIWSALALTTNPDVVKAIHLDYIKAGADYITANNYAVTQPILERADMSDRLEELTLLSFSFASSSLLSITASTSSWSSSNSSMAANLCVLFMTISFKLDWNDGSLLSFALLLLSTDISDTLLFLRGEDWQSLSLFRLRDLVNPMFKSDILRTQVQKDSKLDPFQKIQVLSHLSLALEPLGSRLEAFKTPVQEHLLNAFVYI